MKRSIKIGESKYSIKQVKVIDKDPEVLGLIKHDKKRIYIKKQNGQEDKETLYHEIAHGIIVDLAFSSVTNDKMNITTVKSLAKLNNNEEFIDYFGSVLRNMFVLK